MPRRHISVNGLSFAAMATMREPTYLILLALADAERHGYGVIQEVRALSDQQVRLGAGTLYGALDRLTEEGLVRATRSEVVAGRHRRYYALTDRGLDTVKAETVRRGALAEAARVRLGGRLIGGVA